METKLKEIDGSVLEGGGQILRMALSFSAICNIPVSIYNIRKGRSGPGLKPQHLTGVKLMQEICKASLIGAEIGSEKISFKPNQVLGGFYRANTGTAGSVALLLQVSLPVCYFANNPIEFRLTGGTNCDMAPQIDFLTEVFRPNLEKFGATFDFDLIRRGYFPKGGGDIRVQLNPVRKFTAVQLCEQGEITEIFGWSFVAGQLPVQIAHEMADGAMKAFRHSEKFRGINVNIDRYKEDPKIAAGNCSGIILVCKTNTNCILGGSALGNRKTSSFQTGSDAAQEIIEAITQGACVDKHTQDMLIIFMALAEGCSSIRTGNITLHTKTAIHVAEEMTKAKFEVINEGPETNIIRCTGIGKINENSRNSRS